MTEQIKILLKVSITNHQVPIKQTQKPVPEARKQKKGKKGIGMSAQRFSLSSVLVVVAVVILLIKNIEASTSLAQVNGSSIIDEMVPLMEPLKVVEMRMVLNDSRRRLSSFQICALCTCCGGAKGVCLASPCCYTINCNIPNRPFGFCSFTPKACNCFGCHL